MKVHIYADKNNTKNILSLLEDQGYILPCNCHSLRRCNGKNYSFDCSRIPHESCFVDLPLSSQPIQSVGPDKMTPVSGFADTLLIDIGTTTVALALIDSESGELRQSAAFANPQISYGADVISRIHAASTKALPEMQHCIQSALEHEIHRLCRKNHQNSASLRFCYIGGNTVMIHLLMGYDCSTLGHSPFSIPLPSPKPFFRKSCLVTIAPWISAFIGGDITSGLSACEITKTDSTALFVDLGTNGEMVLHHKNNFWATSTAAGPALEGAGLSCGCPAIPGAIDSIRLKRKAPILHTIGNRYPVGLCGSGAISLCAELLRKRYISKDGILTDLFPSDGILLSRNPQGTPLLFTADDLRSIQLSTAAIAAGIDMLLEEAHITSSDIEILYLGGGFGFYLSLADCETIGIFSDIPISRIRVMGNTCLQGLYHHATQKIPFHIPKSFHSINPADSPCFRKHFIRHMVFP